MFRKMILALTLNVSALALATSYDHVGLVRDLPFEPMLTQLVGPTLYITERSQESSCGSQHLYAINPNEGGALQLIDQKPNELRCIRKLTAVQDRLLVEIWDGAKVDWKVVANNRFENLKDVFPQFNYHQPYLQARLFGLAKNPQLMKSPPLSIGFNPIENRWSYFMMTPPAAVPAFGPLLVASGLLGDYESEIKVGPVRVQLNEKIVSYSVGEGDHFYIQTQDLSDRRYYIYAGLVGAEKLDRFETGNAAPEHPSGQPVSLLAVERIVGLYNGDALFYEGGDAISRPEILWIFDDKQKQIVRTPVAARDVNAYSSSTDGFLVSRDTGIDWYGTPGRLANQALWEAIASKPISRITNATAMIRVQKNPQGKTILLSRMTNANDAPEMVTMAEITGDFSFRAGLTSGALLANGLLPNLTPKHLQPDMVAIDPAHPNGTNVAAALRFMKRDWKEGEDLNLRSSHLRLHIFSGNRLVLVLDPTPGTVFKNLEALPGERDAYLVRLSYSGNGAPYPYNLYVSGDGQHHYGILNSENLGAEQ